MFKYGVEYIYTGCDLCREEGSYFIDGHSNCIPSSRDSEFPVTVLIRSTWYGFKTQEDLDKFVDADTKEDAEAMNKIHVNVFDYEKVDVCGGTRLRRKVTGRQDVYTRRKKGKPE